MVSWNMVTDEGDGNFISMGECNGIWRSRSRSKNLKKITSKK